MTIHNNTRKIATVALTIDEINKSSSSPNPEIEIGPKILTIIPPPIRIRPHMANKNPKMPFKVKSSSKMQ